MRAVNFLPENIKAQRARKRRLARQGYMLGACAVGLALLGYLRMCDVRAARAEASDLDNYTAEVNRQLDLLVGLQKQQADLMVKKRIDDHLGSRISVLDVLAELEHLMPESMTLRNLTLDRTEVRTPATPVRWQSGVSSAVITPSGARDKTEHVIKRVRLVITGLAPSDVDVANFIGQLSASPVFEDVRMGYARTVEFRGKNARQFEATCYVAR